MTSTEESQQQPANRGFLIALASAAVLSFTGILIRMISVDYGLPALILAFWRELFVVLCALPAPLLFKPKLLKVDRRQWPYLAQNPAVVPNSAFQGNNVRCRFPVTIMLDTNVFCPLCYSRPSG